MRLYDISVVIAKRLGREDNVHREGNTDKKEQEFVEPEMPHLQGDKPYDQKKRNGKHGKEHRDQLRQHRRETEDPGHGLLTDVVDNFQRGDKKMNNNVSQDPGFKL